MTDDAPIARVQRVMPATPAVVFDQWLDRESLREWMCPHPVRVVDLTVEPRVGGNVRFDIDDLGTRVLITGHFAAIDRPRLLRFTWSASDWPDHHGQYRHRHLRAGRQRSDTHDHRAFPAARRRIRRLPERVGRRLRSARRPPTSLIRSTDHGLEHPRPVGGALRLAEKYLTFRPANACCSAMSSR